ncbi:helix-turn-helix domain-containing protein [Eubacterium ramulus]|uniref:helix-turn-helix domain-containing protein n=1 Tax=Eubacterium ramulus TaxID=39490 RepID=UPI0035208225
MSFTDKLDALMAEKGINKSILSKESGIPYTTIAGFYTKGTDNVKLSTLKKIIYIF